MFPPNGLLQCVSLCQRHFLLFHRACKCWQMLSFRPFFDRTHSSHSFPSGSSPSCPIRQSLQNRDCQDRRLVIWNLPCACFYQISDFSSFAMGSDFGSSCADLVSSSLSSFSTKKPFSSSARAKKDSRFS